MTTCVWKDTSIKEVSDRLVMLALADSHNSRTGLCNPSIDVLARKTQLHPVTIHKSLKRLGTDKKISKVAGGGRWHTNSYQLCYDTKEPGVSTKGAQQPSQRKPKLAKAKSAKTL